MYMLKIAVGNGRIKHACDLNVASFSGKSETGGDRKENYHFHTLTTSRR